MKDGPKINFAGIIIGLLALLNAAIHLYFSNNLEFHRDELLYFSLGQHPALGYATVPPLTGWVAWLMQNLFGFSIFAVRLFPALMGGLMVFLVSAMAKELGDRTIPESLQLPELLCRLLDSEPFCCSSLCISTSSYGPSSFT